MTKRTIFTAAALAATSALALAACDSGQRIADNQANISASGMDSGRIYPAACAVRGRTSGATPYSHVGYDFKYGAIIMTRSDISNRATGYTVPFNTISNPAVQAEVRAAHALLPASANCPAPVFAPVG